MKEQSEGLTRVGKFEELSLEECTITEGGKVAIIMEKLLEGLQNICDYFH